MYQERCYSLAWLMNLISKIQSLTNSLLQVISLFKVIALSYLCSTSFHQWVAMFFCLSQDNQLYISWSLHSLLLPILRFLIFNSYKFMEKLDLICIVFKSVLSLITLSTSTLVFFSLIAPNNRSIFTFVLIFDLILKDYDY